MFTATEAAAYLRRHVRTLYLMLESGTIPGYKIDGRWLLRPDEIDAWVDQRSNQPQGDGSNDGNGPSYHPPRHHLQSSHPSKDFVSELKKISTSQGFHGSRS